MIPLSTLSLRQIECFLEIARTGSTRAAAEALNITQSAASRRLTELEALLERQLFEREGRRLRLSEQGLVFMELAQTIRRAVSRVGQTFVPERMALETVTIGAMPSVAGTLVPRAVARLRDVAGHISVRVTTGASTGLLNMLRAGELDLVVGRMPHPDRLRSLRFEPLYRDRLGFVVRVGHPLLADNPPKLERVVDFPCIVPARDAVIGPLAQDYLASHGLAWPVDRIEATSSSFSLAMLPISNAVWFISRGVAEPAVARGDVSFLDIDTGSTSGAIGIVTNASDEVSSAVAVTLQVLRELGSRNTEHV